MRKIIAIIAVFALLLGTSLLFTGCQAKNEVESEERASQEHGAIPEPDAQGNLPVTK